MASEPAIAACDVLTSSLAAILAPSSQPMRGLFALEDAEPVSVSLEAISAPEREKEKRIAALLTTVRNHPAYRALEPLDGFKRIMRSREELAASHPKFAGPLGEIRLVRELALYVGGYGASFKLRRATRQDNVISACRTLFTLLQSGAEPEDWSDARQLRELLLLLDRQLTKDIETAKQENKRSGRADKDEAQRTLLIQFSISLFLNFDVAPPTIVCEVAELLGFEPDQRTIERYVSQARIDWEKLVARANARA